MKNSGVRLAVGLLVGILILLGIGGGLVWLKIASLKTQLADDLGRALHAQVQVSSLSLNVMKGEINAAGVSLTNLRPEAPWDHGEISQATVHFHLHDLLASTLPLEVEVSSWRVVLRPRSSASSATPSGPETASEPSAPSSHRVQVTHLAAQEGEVEIDLDAGRQILIHGVSFDATSNGAQVWTTQLQATSLTAGSLQLGASSVQLRSEPDKVTFTSLHMACANGAITGNGEIALSGLHDAQMDLTAVDVPVSMLVSIQWQMKLSGLATGTLAYRGNDQGNEAHGQVSLAGAKFNVLPFLGKMTTLVGLPDISGVEVDKATGDFAWKDRALHLTNIDVRKNDVTRIAGTVDIDATSQVDGHLKLGFPDTVLGKWPQLQTAVFPTDTDQYSWADVHLTGTPDHLQEDLSSRVLAIGVQQGGTLIQQGAQKASDLLKSILGQ